MIFNHLDTGKSYRIPEKKCVIEEFSVIGNALYISTGESIVFRNHADAESAWCLFEECFRQGWSRLSIHEKAGMAYSMFQ